MKPILITYENMVGALLRELPEVELLYDSEIRRWGVEMGQHIMYRYVLYKSIEEAVHSQPPKEALLRKIFRFLEKLLAHRDQRVREVAHQSVCDKICSDEVVLQKTRRFMGAQTKNICDNIIGKEIG